MSARVVAEMTVRALVRRRVSLALFVLLPVILYVARHDGIGQSTRALLFGVSWSMSTVAFFAATAAAGTEPRLRLAGWTTGRLVAGRVLGLTGAGVALSAAYLGLVLADHPIMQPAVLALDFAVTTLTAIAFGTALGAVVPRELEGSLALFLVAALQSVVNPESTLAKLLPFWSSRELGTVAIDGPDAASLALGLTHAATTLLACTAITLAMSARRP